MTRQFIISAFSACALTMLASPALAQTCATTTTSTLGALSARKTNTSIAYIEFEGACVRGAIDCSLSSIPGISVITTCAPVPAHVQASIVRAMANQAGQGAKEIAAFITKCVIAKSERDHPTDEYIGKVVMICTDFDRQKGSIELRADPR